MTISRCQTVTIFARDVHDLRNLDDSRQHRHDCR